MTFYIILLPFVLLNLERVERKEEKLQKFEYLENEKSFLDEIKTFFTVFEGLSFGEKIKISEKIADASFNVHKKTFVTKTECQYTLLSVNRQVL